MSRSQSVLSSRIGLSASVLVLTGCNSWKDSSSPGSIEDFITAYWVLSAAFAIALGMIPAAIAQSKGKSFLGWWVFGTLFFIIALPVAILVTPDTQVLEERWLQEGLLKKCPYCAELIKKEAKVCKHCGKDLPSQPRSVPELSDDRLEQIRQVYRAKGWCEVCGAKLGFFTRLSGHTRCGRHR